MAHRALFRIMLVSVFILVVLISPLAQALRVPPASAHAETIKITNTNDTGAILLRQVITDTRAADTIISSIETIAKPTPAAQHDIILDIPVDAQDHLLSCEASVAAMAAQYYRPTPPEGYTNWEQYFVKAIPIHCNPHRGFRGNIDGLQRTTNQNCDNNRGPYGYGVYAEPVAAAMTQIGVNAQVEYGVDYQAVAEAVKGGHPVMVWIFNPVYYKKYNPGTMRRIEIDPETHQEYALIEGEHILIVRGVSGDEKRYYVNDPYRGRVYWISAFNLWEEFNGMRVIIGPAQ